MVARIATCICFGLGLVWLGLADIASAHGPVRQKLTEKIEIDAPPAKVWAVIGSFQDLSWVPGVAKTTGEGGNTPDAAKRQIVLANGGTIEESLNKYDAGEMTYSYRIDKVDIKVLPVTNYSSTISVLPADGGKSLVEWKGAFYRGYPNNDPPPDLSDEAAIKAVGAFYKAGLAALKKKVEGGK
jgi:carbon monoxide dehydrogenase subunit G